MTCSTDEDDAGGVEVPEAGCRMLCQNGGRCQMDAQLGAMCVCAAGFAGHICEQRKNLSNIMTIFAILAI